MADNTFGNEDVFNQGISDGSLFTTRAQAQPLDKTENILVQQAITPPKLSLTAQAKLQQAQQQNALIQQVTQQINSMRASPEWQNAGTDERQQMLDTWKQTKYQPWINTLDPSLQVPLLGLSGLLQNDIDNQQDSIDLGPNRFIQGVQGAVADVAGHIQNFVDYRPAQQDAATLNQLAQYKAGTLNPIQKATVDAALASQGLTVDQLQNKTLQDLKDKDASAQYWQNLIDEQHKAQGLGAVDRERNKAFSQQQHGDIYGTVRYGATHLRDTAEGLAESAPDIITSALAYATNPILGLSAGGILGAAQANQAVINRIKGMSDTELKKSPMYNDLLNQGLSPEDAKIVLAYQPNNAEAIGAAIGAITGAGGIEAGVGRALASHLGAEAVAPAATLVGRIAQGTATGTGRSLINAAQAGGTQAAQNLGVEQATGTPQDLTQGVGQAAAEGFITGLPIGIGGDIAVRRAEPTTSEGIYNVPTNLESPVQRQSEPTEPTAATEGTQGTAQEVPTSAGTTTASNIAGLTRLRQTINDAMARTEPLSAEEFNTLAPQLHQLEQSGVRTQAIERGLNDLQTKRGLPDGSADTLVNQYRTYVDNETARAAQELAEQVTQPEQAESLPVTPESLPEQAVTEPQNLLQGGSDGTITTADNTGVSASDTINREMGTSTPSSEPATDELPTGSLEADPIPQDTGISGATGDDATTNVSDAAATTAMGADTAAPDTNSRPSSEPATTSSEAGSVSERSISSPTTQRSDDAGSGTGASPSTTGVEPTVLNIGDVVTYTPTFRGGRAVTGTIDSVNSDGSVNLRTPNNTVIGNLNRDQITPTEGTANAIQEPSPASQVLRQQQPEVELQQVGSGNTEEQAASQTSQDAGQTQEIAQPVGLTTSAGRNVEYLNSKVEPMLDFNNPYVSDVLDLAHALDNGDYEQVDRIADSLYLQGLREFAPPQTNDGEGGSTIHGAYMDLTGAERTALQNEYARLREELPPEVSSFNAFRDAAVQDELLTQAGAQPLTGILPRLSAMGRRIITKLSRALLTVMTALSLNHIVNIHDARAAEGYAVVTRADRMASLSDGANVVNNWIRQSKDNNGQRYIIADKARGELYVMDASGQMLARSPALYGRQLGDGMSLGETPAGVFTLQERRAPSAYGGDIEQFSTAPNGDIYAIHRVLTNNPKQRRLQRLQSNNAVDHRVSLGCINLPSKFYDQYLSKGFGGKLYILPDQGKLETTFKDIAVDQSKTDLTRDSTLPQNLGDGSNEQFRSSTINQTEPVDGARVRDPSIDTGATIEAANDSATAHTSISEVANDASDAGGIMAAGLPFLWMSRRNTKAKEGETDANRTADPKTSLDDEPNPTSPGYTSGIDTARIYTGGEIVKGKRYQSWQNNLRARKLRTQFRDAASPLAYWEYDSGLLTADKEFDEGAVFQSFKLVQNKQRNLSQDYLKKYITPIDKVFHRVAKDTGRDVEEVMMHMSSWVTMQHIPEANARLYQNLLNDLDNAVTADEETYNQALNAVQFHELHESGTGVKVRMAGGFTTREANNIAANIERMGYKKEDLEEVKNLIHKAIEESLQDRVSNGTLLPEQYAELRDNEFKNYVPLYVDHSDTGGDIFLGTSALNPIGDHYRQGSLAPANHAYATLHQFLHRTASGIATEPFKAELNRAYRILAARGDTKGLNREVVNQYMSNDARNAQGFIYRRRQLRDDGTPQVTTYKLWFDDDNITKGMQQQIPNTLQAGLERLTRMQYRLLTKYHLNFAPVTFLKDVGERVVNTYGRDLKDARGNAINPGKIARATLANSMNPQLISGIALQLAGKDGGLYGRYYQELKDNGGLSTFQDAIAKNTSDMVKQLKSSAGWRKQVKELGGIQPALHYYNETFGAAAAVANYKAMRDAGMSKRDAAFRTLDMQNYNNRGTATGWLRAINPFVGATLEGGFNLIRTLEKPRGRMAALGLVVASASLYSMFAAMAPDDSDYGNKMDVFDLGELSNYIPLWTDKDGGHFKIPVPFGLPQLAWVTGAALNRLSRGVISPEQAIAQIGITLAQNFIQTPLGLGGDNVVGGFVNMLSPYGIFHALTPSILTPELEALANKNAYGGIIHAQASAGERASDAGMSKTPTIWINLAKGIANATGGTVDMYPETIRHIVMGHMIGPMTAITTFLESDSQYKSGGRLTTNQELGPFLDAIGVPGLWGNDNMLTSRIYYKHYEDAMGLLTKYGVSPRDAGNIGHKGAGPITAAQRLLAAGATPQEANQVMGALQAENQLQALNRGMRQQVKLYNNVNIDLKNLAPQYQALATQQEQVMRQYIRQMRMLQ